MKIGIDCRLWNESGVGRYVRNLVEQLLVIDRKNSYALFVLSRDKENIKYQISKIKNNWKLEIRNWKLIVADVRWHTLEEQLRFPQILYNESLDLVHFPYFSVPIFYNKAYVVTIHDLILHHFPTGLTSTLPIYLYKLKLLGYKFVIKCAAQNAKKIITVSNATKSEIVEHLGVSKDKMVVTYEGVDSKISNIKYQISKTHIKNQKYFLYVGNAYPHKNLDRLVQALSILVSQYPNILLFLVGKEDYFYKRLKQKVRDMGLEKAVLFYGQVSDEELVGLYKNAKALVMPSLMEGFGLPGLEAMANKCLVLASDIPSLHEVYGNAAMYFDPYDPKDIAEKMREACFNDLNHFNSPSLSFPRKRESRFPIRSGMTKMRNVSHFSKQIEIGLERTKMFSWEKMARETLKTYESCK